jgi:hypothetical protein
MWFLKIQSKKIRKYFSVTYVRSKWDNEEYVIYQNN